MREFYVLCESLVHDGAQHVLGDRERSSPKVPDSLVRDAVARAGLVLRLLDGKADPNLANTSGVLPPRWTREVWFQMQQSKSTAAALRAFAVEKACKECLELEAASNDGKKGKKGKKGKGGGKKGKKK